MKIASFAFVFLMVLTLAACSGASAQPTATAVDIGAMQTSAVQTVVADITQTAAAIPTATLAATIAPSPTATEAVTATIAVTPTQTLCDNSVFVSDVSVIDGTHMTPGQAFVKTWKFKNTGTCTWTTGYQIIWSHGEKLGGQSTALGSEVQPGGVIEISVNMIAPTKDGNYSGYWRLSNNNGFPFGERASVIIVVP